ncbi:hypothetical protein [Streptomyces sp. NPDC004008]
MSFESHLLPPDRIAEPLSQAGLVVTARLMQAPGEGGPADDRRLHGPQACRRAAA